MRQDASHLLCSSEIGRRPLPAKTNFDGTKLPMVVEPSQHHHPRYELPCYAGHRATAPESKVARRAQLCASHWVQGAPPAMVSMPRAAQAIIWPCIAKTASLVQSGQRQHCDGAYRKKPGLRRNRDRRLWTVAVGILVGPAHRQTARRHLHPSRQFHFLFSARHMHSYQHHCDHTAFADDEALTNWQRKRT